MNVNRQQKWADLDKNKTPAFINTEVDEFSIKGNSTLTEILINNLFLNAIRHNNKNGKIIIHIENNQLIFSNTGKETPLVIDKLFNRFSKVNPSSQGNGLGLAIIKKIGDINQWKIDYAFNNQLHNFRIKF